MSSPQFSYDVSTLTVEEYFGYSPSLALAATAIGLYFAAALVIVVQLLIAKNKNALYMYIVVFTGLTEAGGYVALTWMIKNTGSANLYGAYVTMQVLVVLSPNLLQAVTYKTVGKISVIAKLDKMKFWTRPNVISWGFILADIVALVVQAIGISIWASEKSSGTPNVNTVKLGSWITVGGLAFQLICFMIFVLLARWIQTHKENRYKGTREHRLMFIGMYATVLFVSIRNVYRFVEFVQGAIEYPQPSSIQENQALFYGLDTLPIILSFVCFIIINPAFLLPKGHLHEVYSSEGESSDDLDKLEVGSTDVAPQEDQEGKTGFATVALD